MKGKIHKSFAILTIVIVSAFAASLRAAQPVVLHAFSSLDSYHNLDGAGPIGGLVPVGDTLYGVACCGGPFDFGITLGMGTIYSLNRDGGDFRVVRQFEGTTLDGGRPQAGLVASGDVLFGTVNFAGDQFFGGIYSVQTDGSKFTLVHAFAGEDAITPLWDLTLNGDALYGTSSDGGNLNGTLYSVKTNGTDFHVFYTFSPFDDLSVQTNTDGAHPLRGGLTVDGSLVYGAASIGGQNGNGTIFKINTNGSGFTLLRDSNPHLTEKMIVSSGVLYGATANVGAPGTVFSMNTDGSNFRTLHSFPPSGNPPNAFPGSLLLSGDKLYGSVVNQNSATASGAIFQMNTDGTGYKVLYTLSGLNQQTQNTYGAYPNGPLLRIDNELYFTTGNGGPFASGTIDRLAIPISPASLQIEKTPQGVRLLLIGDLAATYVLEDTDLLPTPTWRDQQNILITQTPQPIDIPAATAPTYWCARVLYR
jgi:uncharacterized repeat protein (TIGR03803 family)